MAFNLFKLEMLTITAHKTGDRNDILPPPPSFTAMFNPATYSRSYRINWLPDDAPNSSGSEQQYGNSESEEVKFDLILDGTNADEMLATVLYQKLMGTRMSVPKQVEKFLAVAYHYKGDLHEPAYLVARWGDSLTFNCRLASADIKYTLFDRDATPLRAELSVALISDEEAKFRARLENKKSPDLTHARTVCRGDTLPLLSTQVYGSPVYYLQIARFNQLDDFRNLEAGRELLFPPLVQLLAGEPDAGKGS